MVSPLFSPVVRSVEAGFVTMPQEIIIDGTTDNGGYADRRSRPPYTGVDWFIPLLEQLPAVAGLKEQVGWREAVTCILEGGEPSGVGAALHGPNPKKEAALLREWLWRVRRALCEYADEPYTWSNKDQAADCRAFARAIQGTLDFFDSDFLADLASTHDEMERQRTRCKMIATVIPISSA